MIKRYKNNQIWFFQKYKLAILSKIIRKTFRKVRPFSNIKIKTINNKEINVAYKLRDRLDITAHKI